MNDWLPGATRSPQSGGVTLDKSLPPRAVWHITWDRLGADGSQPKFSAVSNYLKNVGYCPHIMWNPFTGEIEQFYPASVGGRALKYNNQDGQVCVQIEVFFTPGCIVNGKKYNTVAETPLKGWDALIAWLQSLGVPNVWPLGAPQWANNSRDVATWNGHAGHYGHCHSPGDDHTDPGPMPAFPKPPAPTHAPTPAPIPEEEDMTPTITLMREPDGTIWATQDFITKWHVPDPSWITHYLNVEKWGWLKLRRDNKGNYIHSMPAFGAEVAAPTK
jgi:hypothetical protein